MKKNDIGEKEKLFFDIGCNKGLFYETCLAKYPNKCRVVAVDANPLFCVDQKIDNLTILNYALSDKSGEKKTMFVDPNQLGISTLSEWWTKESRFAKGSKYLREGNSNWSQTLVVETETLDNLVAKYGEPDWIKLDVEGYEYEVLLGLTQKPKKENIINFEFCEEGYEEANKCIKRLSEIGYTQFGICCYHEDEDQDWVTKDPRGDTHLKLPKVWLSFDEFSEKLKTFMNPERAVTWGMIYAK